MLETQFKEAYTKLRESNHILLTTHEKMDGDGLSSMLSLYIILKEHYGKQVTLLCHDSTVPEVFRFLPYTDSISFEFSENREFVISVANRHANVEQVRYVAREDGGADIVITPKAGDFEKSDFTFSRSESTVDCIVVMDSSDLKHLGHIYENNKDLFARVPVINIDHHASNEQYGSINLVDTTSVSTTEVIYHMLMQEDPERINEEVATNLLTGIIVDTRSFQNANTTGRSLEVASELLRRGAKQQEIIKHVYKTKKLSTLKLWGKVLSRIQDNMQYRYVWSVITKRDLQELGAQEAEADGIIDELMSNAPNADIILLFKEGRDDVISVSVRTKSKEVSGLEIVQAFGGGGHIQAAGCKLPGLTLQEAQDKVLEVVKEYQLRNERITTQGMRTEVTMPRMEDNLKGPLFDEGPTPPALPVTPPAPELEQNTTTTDNATTQQQEQPSVPVEKKEAKNDYSFNGLSDELMI